jgi:hypothetical protein
VTTEPIKAPAELMGVNEADVVPEHILAWRAGFKKLMVECEVTQGNIMQEYKGKPNQGHLSRVLSEGRDKGGESFRLAVSAILGRIAGIDITGVPTQDVSMHYYNKIIGLGRAVREMTGASSRGISRGGDSSAFTVTPPPWDAAPLLPEERRLLTWLLEVIRCSDQPHVVDIAKKSVRLWRDQMAATRGEASKD